MREKSDYSGKLIPFALWVLLYSVMASGPISGLILDSVGVLCSIDSVQETRTTKHNTVG